MGWDAWLVDDRGHTEGDWNYTYNTGPMIYDALDRAGISLDEHRNLWNYLQGKTGAEGGFVLAAIVRELEADPDHYRAMNPPNGWGDYEGILKVLTDMRNSVPEWPTTWHTC